MYRIVSINMSISDTISASSDDWDSDDQWEAVQSEYWYMIPSPSDVWEYEDRQRYMGTYHVCDRILLLDMYIPTRVFLQYDHNHIMTYVDHCSYPTAHNRNIQLMQMYIHGDGILKEYTVVIKTFWIRWIQRAFKRRYAMKRRWSISRLLHRERVGVTHYPSLLRGLLTATSTTA